MMQSTLAVEEPPSTPKGKVLPITTGIHVDDGEDQMEKGEQPSQDVAATTPPTTTKRKRFLVIAAILALAAVVGVLAGVLTGNRNARTLTPDETSTQSDTDTKTGTTDTQASGCDNCEDNNGEFFCKYPVGSCGETDDIGECYQRPTMCTMQYDPVCGCDGKTYGNACTASSRGVSIHYEGECKEQSLSTTESSSCDSDSDCEENEFCLFPIGECGEASGECTAEPEGCGTVYEPVCGCNQMTYSNECFARAFGESILAGGACADPDETTVCSDDDDCVEEGYFCMFEEGSCGIDDSDVGECTLKPEACTMEWAPVCGCNGQTYGNACGAAGDGMSVAAQGECESDRTESSCTDTDCESGDCILVYTNLDCGASSAGNCESRPEACPRIDDPVCGCDGVTYFNDCEAKKEGGVSVASIGECPT